MRKKETNKNLIDFPKMTLQQKDESDSYAILLYHFRNLGIFRSQRQSDFGIDFEIELLEKGQLTGKFIQIQVKSADVIKTNKNKVPYINGIKKTTLWYWANLSFHSHVFLMAVGLNNERIYSSRVLFWQIIEQLEPSKAKTRTLYLEKAFTKQNNKAVYIYVSVLARSPSLQEELFYLKLSFLNFSKYLKLYQEANWYDPFLPLEKKSVFIEFLQICKCLLWNDLHLVKSFNSVHIFDVSHWIKESDKHCPLEVANFIAGNFLKIIFPKWSSVLLIKRKKILRSKLFWLYQDKDFLQAAYELNIPNNRTHKQLLSLGKEEDLRNDDYLSYINTYIKSIKENIGVRP